MTTTRTILNVEPHGIDNIISAGAGGRASQLMGHDAPILAGLLTPDAAVIDRDDFLFLDKTNQWADNKNVTGSATATSAVGGTVVLDAGDPTNDQGVQIQRVISSFQLSANKSVFFEARIKIGTSATGGQFFVGLATLDTTLFAFGEISANDYVGFITDATKQAGGDAGKMDFELKANGQSAEATTNAHTIALDTYVRLGFKIDGTSTYQPFVDGSPITSPVSITNAPTGLMAPSFACLAEGAQPTMTIDWFWALLER